MVRQLYRVYLYAVCTSLLITATATTGVALGQLLSGTFLDGPYGTSPGYNSMVQSIVTLATVWLVTLAFGGLHYWLIRRDMAAEPHASRGGVRSYFLNITQLFAALVAIGEFAFGIALLGNANNSATSSFAAALASAGLFALLQWERRRAAVSTKVALGLQRVHLFGAQLGIVFLAAAFLIQAVAYSVEDILIAAGNANPCDYYYLGPTCLPSTTFPVRQLLAQWAATLFVAACWFAYTFYTRFDRFSRLRQALHLLAFGFGLSFLLRGAQGILTAMLRSLVGHPIPSQEFAGGAGQAVGALVFGLVVLLAYRALYARESPNLPSGVPTAGLIQLALIAVVFAQPFWTGLHSLLLDIVERTVPAGAHPLAEDVAGAASVFLSGLPFIAFAIWLGIRTRQTSVTWPHRVYVLILLASGTIATAGGLVVALRAFGSQLLGAPPQDWQQTARQGLVIVLVGGTLAAIYATLAVRNRYLAVRQDPKQDEPLPASVPSGVTPASPASPETVESILDRLLAGRISRDEAAARIRGRALVS